MIQNDTTGPTLSIVIQRGMGSTHILQYGDSDKLDDKKT
jgi:hypothetical protein